jgi:type IV pilus assembly protein PilM
MTLAASLKDQIDELMSKLNPGGVVGVDIGAHSIKVCSVSGGPGKYKIDHFGIYTLSEAALIEDEIQKPTEIVDGVLEALQKAKIKSKTLCLGLFGPNTMTKRLSVPEGNEEEIEDHILWEAEQYITFGADDSQIDYHILGENAGGGKDALVVAAKSEVVNNFMLLLKQAKLNTKIVDLNVIALTNVFEEVCGDNLEKYAVGTLIIDYGAQSTKIIIYKRGGPIFTKEIPVGGGLITEEIQRQMGVSYEEAEDLKTSPDLPEEILNIINVQLDQHIAEIKKNINFYISAGSTEKVDYCFVTGGSILLPGFFDKLTASTGMAVNLLDIQSAFKFDENKLDLSFEQFSAISPVVIGLAMRMNG